MGTYSFQPFQLFRSNALRMTTVAIVDVGHVDGEEQCHMLLYVAPTV